MKKLALSAFIGVAALSASANQHTLVFDGNNDINGLVRQTSTDKKEWVLTQDFSFTEAGIDFSIKNSTPSDGGFALVNAKGVGEGLVCFSDIASTTHITPVVDLTVPGGKISSVKVAMSGLAMASLELDFGGEEPLLPELEGAVYVWDWSDEEGMETVSFTWPNKYYQRYFHWIEVTYTEDLGGKKECGLAFNETKAEAIIGHEYTLPVLSNPNNLAVTWTSSDEKVATVNSSGELTLTGGGKTVISAGTAGNADFAPGNARYELLVIPVASNAKELSELAPADFDRVYIDFPATVTFPYTSIAYIKDEEGNAACFRSTVNDNSTSSSAITIYKVGDIIPAGWTATNVTQAESITWEGIPPKVEEQTTVTYPEVESVSPEDVNRVVTFPEMIFTTTTPYGNNKVYGKTPDGKSYEFQNTYEIQTYPAGTYSVTCVVRYAKSGNTVYFWLAPISFGEPGSGVADINVEEGESRYFNLDGTEVTAPSAGLYIKVTDGKAGKVLVK